MYAVKSQFFQKINECITQNQYFSLKIHGFSSYHLGWFVIWYSNSVDEMTTPFLILDRGVELWGSKSRIFECMQWNHHFFRKLIHVLCKIITFSKNHLILKLAPHIEDPRSDPRILSTRRPLHYASSIGVSISEAPKSEFSNVCSEIITFSEN